VTDTPTIFSADYYRKLAALERTHPWFRGTRQVAAAVIRRVFGNPPGGLRILDAGCGTGATIEWLRQFAGRHPVVGIDLSPAAVRLASRAGRTAIAAAEGLPFADGSFDLIYCADMVQHLELAERTAALAEFFRVLRTGGGVVIRSNLATGRPDNAEVGYAEFDYRRFPAELEAQGFHVPVAGRIAVLSELASRFRKQDAGSGWKRQGLAVAPLSGFGHLVGMGLTAVFAAEALAFSNTGRLPAGGTSSLFVGVRADPFERA
jgi:SAM-dependent methyltransferase